MAPIVFLIQTSLGEPFVNEGVALKLARLLCWEEKEKGVECCSSLHIWTIWKERNQRTFENKEQNDQWLKLSFLYNLSSWVSMYIMEDSMPLLDFEEWVGSC